MKPVEVRVESAWFQRLQLRVKCDWLLSSFGFNFNLCPYAKGLGKDINPELSVELGGGCCAKVRRCRLN